MKVGIAVIAACVACAWPAAAVADDPPFVGWTALLPALAIPYDVTSPDDCAAGRTECVDKTIREMTKRFDPLVSSCDHNAIFALVYLRVTEEYRRTIDAPFFEDTPFVNYEDGIFAHYYFAAYDAWASGQRAEVPPAWRIAFDSARSRQVSAIGDLLLGINAHVQRDLPFVLYGIGLVAPDGSSRKPDHDRVDEILNRVTDDVVSEIARRFDATIDDTNLPGPVDEFTLFQLLVAWREAAWRNAEALATAPTAGARDLIAAQIESNAATTAAEIKLATQYPPLSSSRAERDSYCAAHRYDP